MFRKFWKYLATAVLAISIASGVAFAQNQTVSGTVLDPSNKPYASGTYRFEFVPGPGGVNLGTGASTALKTGSLNSSGAFSGVVLGRTDILGGGSRWQATICSAAEICFSKFFTVVSTTSSLSTLLSTGSTSLTAENPAVLAQQTVTVTEGVSPSYKLIYGNLTVPSAVTGATQYYKAVQGLTTIASGANPAEVWGVYGIVNVNGTGNAYSSWPVVGELSVNGTGNYGNAQDNSFQPAGYFHSWINATKTFLGGVDAPLVGDIDSATGRRKADAAVLASLNGAISQSTAGAGAAYLVRDWNTGANFDFGSDYYYSSGSYANVFANGEFRLSNGAWVISGTAATRQAAEDTHPTAPVGSIYDSTAGKIYLKVADAGANTDWQLVTTSAAD